MTPSHAPAVRRPRAGSAGPGPASRGVLQRCSCGGAPGPTGECKDCRRKRKLGLQARLRVGPAGDRYEREADRIAASLAAGGGAPSSGPLRVTPLVQRNGGSAETTAPDVVNRVLAEPGRPLDCGTRRYMEAGFGREFGHVRIHAGPRAADAARSVGARAFTVGSDVAFDAGEYRPESTAGRRLLAHELTHTIQQGATNGPARIGGNDPARTGGAALQRQPSPSPDPPGRGAGPLTPARAAELAEATCDVGSLCRLHFAHPDIVPDSRVARVVQHCRPGVLVSRAPCLDLSVIDPQLYGGAAPGAGAAVKPGSKKAAGKSGAGLPDFGKLLTFELHTGDGTFTVKLPTSLTFKLPVEFRGASKLTFEMSAKASGAFSFSITLDGIPHVQIKSTTTADVSSKTVKSEIKISSSMKTCHAPDSHTTRESLKKAGEKLKTAIEQVNKSPAQVKAEKAAKKTGATVHPSPPEGLDRLKRLGDVVSGIVDVKKAVDKAKAGCKPKPTISFGITGKAPMEPSSPNAPAASITGNLIINF